MKKASVSIDLLRDEDNAEILKLSHTCPQRGIVEAYPDRSPVFRRLHKQLSPKSYHIVARKADSLIGAFGAVYTNLKFRSTEFDAAFLVDLKVHPDYRRSTVAYRLVKETVRHLREENNTNLAVATFLKDNEYSLIFTQSRAGVPEARYLGDFRVFNLVPLKRYRVSGQFSIGHPTEEDIPELVNLYNKFYSGYKLAPRMTEALLRYYCNEIDGMDLGQFWVARQGGSIRAVLCAWEQVHYKRWFVNRLNKKMKMVSFALKALGHVFKMPAPLKEGSSLTHIALVMGAHDGCISGMKALIRSINNFYLGKEYTVLQTHFNDKDPVNEALKGLVGFAVHSEAHVFTEDPELAKEIAEDERLVHFEWPMFI